MVLPQSLNQTSLFFSLLIFFFLIIDRMEAGNMLAISVCFLLFSHPHLMEPSADGEEGERLSPARLYRASSSAAGRPGVVIYLRSP